MVPLPDDEQQTVSQGAQSPQEQNTGAEPSNGDQPPAHGSTGEGAGSAMARLISQEQARIVPGAPDDAPNGSS
jgi:hypothetical protein